MSWRGNNDGRIRKETECQRNRRGIAREPASSPQEEHRGKDQVQAQYHINLLGILRETTRGNLSQEEEQALEQMLYELRMNYVQAV